ncbi:hypothetical protein E2C01_026146 [Portunus trituberculatus]|uniref:Uncharacterized protein n=1 Tax=Portunus trituberculatus TaxID=210409 RepID=A0A5B7EI12_PORTR|nr:hypothetical protein [Portunus trituberculatus]
MVPLYHGGPKVQDEAEPRKIRLITQPQSLKHHGSPSNTSAPQPTADSCLTLTVKALTKCSKESPFVFPPNC